MDIYLVRHGEAATAWGLSSDPGLSELGREQAAATADELVSVLPEDVQLLSSPLLRAQETAQALSERLSKPVTTNNTYCEIPARVGLEERKAWLAEYMAGRWSEQPDYLLDWRQSLYDELTTLTGTTVIFSHFIAINTVVGQITGQPETLCFSPDNASITHLTLTGSELELVALGRQMQTVVN